MRASTLLIVFFWPAAAAAQDAAADKILKEERDNGKVMEYLDELVNKIGPRLTGSDRCAKACEWARDTFAKLGLKDARLDPWGTFPVAFNRGPSSGKIVEPEELDLNCATYAWSAGTPGAVEGPAILAPADEDAATRLGEKLKSAWVVLRGKLATGVADKCEQLGCAGFVWNAGTDQLMCTGDYHVDPDRLPSRVLISVGSTHFKKILAHLAAGKELKLAFDMRNDFKKGPIEVGNVIADLPGTDKADEVVIVGGHIDSWDYATGTCDNGTGVATTIEAARLLTAIGAKPRRTIRFMLWTGEEQGLLGSSAYVRKNPDIMKKVSCVLDHDGGTNYICGIAGTRKMAPLFDKIFAPLKDSEPKMKFKVRKINELSASFAGGGSDHMPFLAARVPAFFWDQTGRANYGYTWHTKNDLYSAAIPDYQKRSASVVAVAALGVADLDELLPRDDVVPGQAQGRKLGVQCEEDLVVGAVFDDTPAARAGLKEGDQILKIGDRKVTDLRSMRAAIRQASKDATVTILRDGKELTLSVTFDE